MVLKGSPVSASRGKRAIWFLMVWCAACGDYSTSGDTGGMSAGGQASSFGGTPSSAAGSGGEAASSTAGAGAGAGSDGGNACQGGPLDVSRWTCFDSHPLLEPGEPAPVDCAFDMPVRLEPGFDLGRLGLIHRADAFFEIPDRLSAGDCAAGVGGWFFAFDDESIPISMQLCGCTCEALVAEPQVYLFTRCE